MKNTEQNSFELFSEYPDVMSVHQLREALGIGRKGVYTLLEKQEIRSFKIGNTYKIPKTSLVEYVQRSCATGGTK